ncbi:hypothetical protein QIT86_gp55 [Pseudomonas phage BUCT566]|uniref:Uncharacterized protein n=1 Tax=Pseudomonas phage BUCT566 TaxID=2829367 RepID=A0A8T8JEH8_9CAUD|nr:hypothetical protein QIT86_gp55 [Pseudomonas phage BUCT566]QUE30243.1 hypothetical protein [Pseudomonas phage BUCT566]
MPGLAGLRGVGYESDLRCRLYLSYLHHLRWRAKHQHYYYVSGVHTAYASFVPTQPFTPSRWAVYGFTDALQQRRSLSLVGWGWPGCQPGKRSENVDSGVISGESPKDTDSPLFVRPPWQARLLHPH